jgi:hypothetical protein
VIDVYANKKIISSGHTTGYDQSGERITHHTGLDSLAYQDQMKALMSQ